MLAAKPVGPEAVNHCRRLIRLRRVEYIGQAAVARFDTIRLRNDALHLDILEKITIQRQPHFTAGDLFRPDVDDVDRMNKARIDEADILEAAREIQGLERIDQITYAVLERGGHITVVPIDKKA